MNVTLKDKRKKYSHKCIISVLILCISSLYFGTVSAQSDISIVTDSSWLTNGQYMDGWNSLNFDDSTWFSPRVIGAPPVAPWGNIPNMIGTNAQWIWYLDGTENLDRFFRKTFTINGPITSAVVKITADDIYYLYVNGNFVGYNNLWRTPEIYDISKYLQQGKNVIAVKALDSAYSEGLLADIKISSTPTASSSDRLNSGDILKVGASIISQNGQYRLTLQGDGNLVLYNSANSPLWASNTMNNNVAQIAMQTDGNMVMMDTGNQQIWSTGTSGNSGAYLIVQNDGNAIIYNIAGAKLWSTSQIQPPNPVTGISARRTIDKTTLMAGSEAIVTIVVQNDNTTRALSLQESIPQGWSFTRISDDADQFKTITNEWAWLSLASNAVKTVKYKLTVPPGTKLGTYNINGHITTSGGTTDVTGDSTISVSTGDMLSYYRGLGADVNKVETSDLLKAADDWRNNIIPQGFSVPIATGQLLTLADEWRSS